MYEQNSMQCQEAWKHEWFTSTITLPSNSNKLSIDIIRKLQWRVKNQETNKTVIETNISMRQEKS